MTVLPILICKFSAFPVKCNMNFLEFNNFFIWMLEVSWKFWRVMKTYLFRYQNLLESCSNSHHFFFSTFFFRGRAMLGLCCFEGFCLVAVIWSYSSCSARASHCSGFSSCGAWALGLWASAVAIPGPSSTDSVVVMHRLSSSAACGIFLDRRVNRVSCTDRWILYHWATREAQYLKVLYMHVKTDQRNWGT